jgi:predicted amidohydrolase
LKREATAVWNITKREFDMRITVRLVGLATGLLGTLLCSTGLTAELTARKPGPRKVIVGTSMYNMFHKYPGPEKRLEELGELIDQMAKSAAEKYPGHKLDIAALPEAAVNGNAKGPASEISLPLEGLVLDTMAAKAREHGCYIVVPLFMVDDPNKDLYSNAAVLLDRSGNVAGIYRKVFPVSGKTDTVLEGGVTPGTEAPVFDCDFGRVGLQICFDIEFDAGWEAMGRDGAELVIWPTQSPGQIRPAIRARQNDYFVLSSTWRNNAALLDPTGHAIREIRGPDGVFVEQIDLDYAIVGWQPPLRNGQAFSKKYGDRAGYRYSEAEDSGIFWSNDPAKPVMEMVRELGLELWADNVARNRALQDEFRGGPAELSGASR